MYTWLEYMQSLYITCQCIRKPAALLYIKLSFSVKTENRHFIRPCACIVLGNCSFSKVRIQSFLVTLFIVPTKWTTPISPKRSIVVYKHV